VGDLVEAVLHRLRADLDRLEEDVVPGVARHLAMPPLEQTGNRHSPSVRGGRASRSGYERTATRPPRRGRAHPRGCA
jgi:hypothetical protein